MSNCTFTKNYDYEQPHATCGLKILFAAVGMKPTGKQSTLYPPPLDIVAKEFNATSTTLAVRIGRTIKIFT